MGQRYCCSIPIYTTSSEPDHSLIVLIAVPISARFVGSGPQSATVMIRTCSGDQVMVYRKERADLDGELMQATGGKRPLTGGPDVKCDKMDHPLATPRNIPQMRRREAICPARSFWSVKCVNARLF